MSRRARAGEAQRWVLDAIASATDDCLVWPFKTNQRGYAGVRWEGRTRLVHCVVLTAIAGPAPSGTEALHSCDDGLCANPRHLRWGTHAENMRESVERGRYNCARGERARTAVLTAQAVQAIRASAATTSDLATQYGVSWNTVNRARSGRSWAHLPMEYVDG